VHNLGDRPCEARLRPTDEPDRLVNLAVADDSAADENGAHRLSLGPYEYRWYRVPTPSSKAQERRA
jgi:maltose alpha-D-glucosyltransferase/alpha-amylase